MGRWTPDARGRLQEAAMTLFFERGYEAVTVSDIAERAGLTKRSFFNHFADKREVVFAAADRFEERLLAALDEADPGLAPLDAAVWAYGQAASMLSEFPELARARGALIRSSPELQERNLMKMASAVDKVAAALGVRGSSPREALLASHAAAAVFTTAVDDWTREPGRGLATAFEDALAGLRAALLDRRGAAEGTPERDG